MGLVLDNKLNLLQPTTEMVKYGAQADVMQFDNRYFWSTAIRIAKDPYKGIDCDEFWPKI